eukprot:TRINITY_DN7714_c0_g1_i1.p1 TRINITY_DN7714_c0_g1~~TRINITY_DN7714_c0_g1_i1.p1  ORF type:complete len:564 (-),score=77.80 TRINITY_DN7714_c0_g1_i1:585-2276(-)
MDSDADSDFAIVCVGVALLCAHLTCSCHVVVSCIKAVRRAIAHVRELLVSLAHPRANADENASTSKEEEDPIGEEVLLLMGTRRKTRMKTCCSIICHVVSVFTATVVLNIVKKSPRWASFAQVIVVLVLLLVALVLNECFSSERQVAVYSSYSVFMLLSALWIAAGDFSRPTSASSGEVMLYTLVAACMLRLLVTVNVLNFRVALFWNVVCSLVTSGKFVLAAPEGPFPSSNFVFLEVILCITVMLMSEGIRKADFAEVLNEAEATAGRIENSASTALLDNVCDVILPVDPTLRITEDVPRFKAMLMLNPNLSVKGLKLDSYIPSEEDKTRLRQQLADSSSSDNDSAVRCFNVTIRDSDGNNIDVEMFSVAFETLGRSRRYMLGIREFSDVRVRLAPLEKVELGQRFSWNAPERASLRKKSKSRKRRGDADASGVGMSEVEGFAVEYSDTYSSPDTASASNRPAAVDALASLPPPLKESSERTRLATTIALIESLSMASTKGCRATHAGLREAKGVLESVQRMQANLWTEGDEQCIACGSLDCFDSGEACNICGHGKAMRIQL